MKYALLLLISLNAISAFANFPRATDYRFPQHSLPALNIHVTQFTRETEQRTFDGTLVIQVLCANGDVHFHSEVAGKTVGSKICRYSQTLWDPVNDRIRLEFGIPLGNKCKPDRVTMDRAALVNHYCVPITSSAGAP